MTPLRNFLFLSAMAIALGIGAPAFAAEATQPKAEAPKPPAISVIAATKREIVETLSVSGNFVAREEILVLPEINDAQVVEILAEEGDEVKKGQVLARLSTSTIEILLAQNDAALARNEAAIAQAKALIAQAQANVQQAKTDLGRTKKLKTSGYATGELFDQRQTALDSADAQLESARRAQEISEADRKATEAQRRELELRRARTEVKAPSDGYISGRGVQLGGIAAMAKDPMFRIVQNGEIDLAAEIMESDLAKLKVRQPASITPVGARRAIAGGVRFIAPEVNTTTRLGSVRIGILGKERVALGSFGRATIEIARAQGVTLPLAAVTFKADGAVVQAVKDGKVEVRKVKTGLIDDTHVEIVAGVAAGETVVAKAGTFVRNGDQITPIVQANQAE
jgi:HlyD family secretion protein